MWLRGAGWGRGGRYGISRHRCFPLPPLRIFHLFIFCVHILFQLWTNHHQFFWQHDYCVYSYSTAGCSDRHPPPSAHPLIVSQLKKIVISIPHCQMEWKIHESCALWLDYTPRWPVGTAVDAQHNNSNCIATFFFLIVSTFFFHFFAFWINTRQSECESWLQDHFNFNLILNKCWMLIDLFAILLGLIFINK